LINFIPLTLAAFSPLGITLVIFLLTSQNGVRKTFAYLISQTLAFAIWSFVFLNLSLEYTDTQSPDSTGVRETLRIFLGIILLVIAVRILLTEQDPDALPLKWRSLIDRINAIALFFVNLLLSLIQLRFVVLIMIGVDMINSAQLPQVSVFISSLILLVVLLWSQFVPLMVFLVFGKQRELALKNLEGWMTRNARYINPAFLGGLGLFLVLGS
jgi:hypothetical protein